MRPPPPRYPSITSRYKNKITLGAASNNNLDRNEAGANVASCKEIIILQISSIRKRIVSGSIAKIKLKDMLGSDSIISVHAPYLYGIVGHIMNCCHSTTYQSYQVDLFVECLHIRFDPCALSQLVF